MTMTATPLSATQPGIWRRVTALLIAALAFILPLIAWFPTARIQMDRERPRLLPLVYNADSLEIDAATALTPARSTIPPHIAEILATNALQRQPMNLNALALLIKARIRQGADRDTIARGVALLPRLGWRSDEAIAILLDASATKVPPDHLAVARYVDSLLRRGAPQGPLFDRLIAMEADPAARAAVVSVLADDPKWRLQYLAQTRDLANAAIATREATVTALLARGKRLSAQEWTTLLNGFADRGAFAPAYRLWRGAEGQETASSAIVSDPDFRTLARNLSRNGWEIAPFDWAPIRGASYSLDTPPGGKGLTIRWNGTGRPLFLTQRISVGNARLRPIFAMIGSGSVPDWLSLSLRCPDGQKVTLTEDLAANGASATQGHVSPCAFPLLELRGLAPREPGPVEAQLQSVSLSSNSSGRSW